MTPREPIIVERTDNSVAIAFLAIVVVGILALLAALVFANFDFVVQDNSQPGQQPPAVAPTTAPDDSIIPTLPAPLPEEGAVFPLLVT